MEVAAFFRGVFMDAKHVESEGVCIFFCHVLFGEEFYDVFLVGVLLPCFICVIPAWLLL